MTAADFKLIEDMWEASFPTAKAMLPVYLIFDSDATGSIALCNWQTDILPNTHLYYEDTSFGFKEVTRSI